MNLKHWKSIVESRKALALVLNAPEFFENKEFLKWLNSEKLKFTWHASNSPAGDYSDVVVSVDPSLNGEGSDSDMPTEIWGLIIAQCKKQIGVNRSGEHILVRITNIKGF